MPVSTSARNSLRIFEVDNKFEFGEDIGQKEIGVRGQDTRQIERFWLNLLVYFTFIQGLDVSRVYTKMDLRRNKKLQIAFPSRALYLRAYRHVSQFTNHEILVHLDDYDF